MVLFCVVGLIGSCFYGSSMLIVGLSLVLQSKEFVMVVPFSEFLHGCFSYFYMVVHIVAHVSTL